MRSPGQGHTASRGQGNIGLSGVSLEAGTFPDVLSPHPVPPQIAGPREPPTQVSVIQDSEATLECNATGKPPPRVTWQRDERPVRPEPGLRLQNRGQRLLVERARAAHAGRYSCVAKNTAGRAERQFTLSVLGEDWQPAREAGRGATGDGTGQLPGSPLVLPGVRPPGQLRMLLSASGLARHSPDSPPSLIYCSLLCSRRQGSR